MIGAAMEVEGGAVPIGKTCCTAGVQCRDVLAAGNGCTHDVDEMATMMMLTIATTVTSTAATTMTPTTAMKMGTVSIAMAMAMTMIFFV